MDATHKSSPAALGFVRPAPSRSLVKICQFFWTAYAKLSEFRLTIHLDASVRSIMDKLKDQRVLLCPNHSAHDDPLVAFGIAAQVHQQFYFLTAREIFRWHPSLRSLWLQHLGCYSVLRASADVESFKATCDLLMQKPNKVVVFPEGEVSHQNRVVMSLESGAERIALHVAQMLSHKGDRAPVYILPVGIVYRFDEDITDKLAAIMDRIEKRLEIDQASSPSMPERIITAFDKMLQALETEHQLPGHHQSLGARIHAFIRHTIGDIGAAVGTTVPEDLNEREQLHYLKKVFINHRFNKPGEAVSDADRTVYRQMKRATNFIGLSDSSFQRLKTVESLAELVCILEQEVCGRVSLRANKTAYVASSKPIDAVSFLGIYDENRLAGAAALTQALYQGINDALLYLSVAYPEHEI